jgi:beta-lactamase superfamily II metal-dependent hydrolase
MIKIKVLHASHGDGIAIEVGSDPSDLFRILIDGGPTQCFERGREGQKRAGPLKLLLQKLKEKSQRFDLAIVTHVDNDHIGGVLAACKDPTFRNVIGDNVWFNSGRLIKAMIGYDAVPKVATPKIKLFSNRLTSIADGVDFDDLLIGNSKCRHILIAGNKISIKHGVITILSPTSAQLSDLLEKWDKEEPSSLTSGNSTDYAFSLEALRSADEFEEDTAVHNASSIAFLLESEGSSALFLGDSLPSTVAQSLRKLGYSRTSPLVVGACKLSHHGSKRNTSPKLLELIRCDKFIVSTNSLRHGLPNKVTLGRIMAASPQSTILFNYSGVKEKVFSPDELEKAGNTLKYMHDEIEL